MSMLNIVSAVSCGFAVICFILYVWQVILLIRNSPGKPKPAGDRADDVRTQGTVADMGKLIEALAKLAESLGKAGPLVGSLIGTFFFLLLAAFTAGLGK